MRVSPIINNKFYQDGVKVKNVQQKNNVAFKSSYDKVFREIYASSYENGEKVIEKLRDIMAVTNNERSFSVRNEYFRSFPFVYKNIRSLTDNLKKIYSDGGSIVRERDRNVVYMLDEKAITFCNPHDTTENVTIGVTGNNEKRIYLEKMNEGCYDYYEFYNHSNYPLSKHKHVSGTGLGAVSSTTRYNPDGSEKSLFDIIGGWF